MSVKPLRENKYRQGVQIYQTSIGPLCYNLSNGTAIWIDWEMGPCVTFRNFYPDSFVGDMIIPGPFSLYDAAMTNDGNEADIAMFYGIEDANEMLADAKHHSHDIGEFLEYCQHEGFLPKRVVWEYEPDDTEIIRVIKDIIGPQETAEQLLDYLVNFAQEVS